MIENAQSKYNEKQSAISDGTNSDLSAVQQEKTLLNNILNNFNVFYQSLLKDVNNYYIDTTNETDKKRQIIIFSDKEDIKLINASGTYKSFIEAVKTYNDAFSSTMIGKEKMHIEKYVKIEEALAQTVHDYRLENTANSVFREKNDRWYADGISVTDPDADVKMLVRQKDLIQKRAAKYTEVFGQKPQKTAASM